MRSCLGVLSGISDAGFTQCVTRSVSAQVNVVACDAAGVKQAVAQHLSLPTEPRWWLESFDID